MYFKTQKKRQDNVGLVFSKSISISSNITFSPYLWFLKIKLGVSEIWAKVSCRM